MLSVWLFLVRSAWSSAVVGQYNVLPLETGCPVLAAREDFSSAFWHLSCCLSERYNFLLTFWRKEHTVAITTSKTGFSFVVSLDLLTVVLGFLLQIKKKVVRSLVSTASPFSYWSSCRSLIWCGSSYFIAHVILSPKQWNTVSVLFWCCSLQYWVDLDIHHSESAGPQ